MTPNVRIWTALRSYVLPFWAVRMERGLLSEKGAISGQNGAEWAQVSFIGVASRRFGIAGELLAFLCGSKRWWMAPMILILLLFGVLLILAQSSAIAPFIYTLF